MLKTILKIGGSIAKAASTKSSGDIIKAGDELHEECLWEYKQECDLTDLINEFDYSKLDREVDFSFLDREVDFSFLDREVDFPKLDRDIDFSNGGNICPLP